MSKPDHLFCSSTDGALYDTRLAAWSKAAPLRAVFSRHCRSIDTAAEFKATLRAGPYAWPGGYPLYLLTSDGAALCFDCGRREIRQILPAIRERLRDGWRVVGCDIDEGSETGLYCEHCNGLI